MASSVVRRPLLFSASAKKFPAVTSHAPASEVSFFQSLTTQRLSQSPKKSSCRKTVACAAVSTHASISRAARGVGVARRIGARSRV